MNRLNQLQDLRHRATMHALRAEPYSEGQYIRAERAQQIARAYWAERAAVEAVIERRRAAYQKRRGAA